VVKKETNRGKEKERRQEREKVKGKNFRSRGEVDAELWAPTYHHSRGGLSGEPIAHSKGRGGKEQGGEFRGVGGPILH